MMKKPINKYERLASSFWESIGEIPIYPCDLEHALLWALPVAVIKLPRLGLSSLRKWLSTRNIEMPYLGNDRRIRACLLARCGSGLIFLDGSDPKDEQRYSLAHEVAHFILDYHIRRHQIINALGSRIAEVLDGEREATIEERLTGILAGVTIGPFIHLMDRNNHNNIRRQYILNVEDAAERFAMELISPQKEVECYLDAAYPDWYGGARQPQDAIAAIARTFGVPPRIIATYITHFALLRQSQQSFKDWIGWQASDH